MSTAESVSGGSVPPLAVRTQGSDQSLPAGPSYLIGRDPKCDIVITDARVSWRHAVLRLEHGRWVLADNGSTNGIYAGYQRVDRIEISSECLIRLGDPADGPVLSCTVSGADPGQAAGGPRAAPLPPATMLRIGRAPDNDVVIADPGVSQYHAELRPEAGGYRIVDLDSRNGTFVNERRVTAAMVSEGDLVGVGSSTFQLVGHELQEFVYPDVHSEETPPPAASLPAAPVPAPGDGPLEIPYAVRWLVPRGERFANFDILNDNDTQLDYYRQFGHIYAVGIPTKKWRLVVVSDPELLDEVAGDEERFGKRVEEINFFAQLSNTRGGGISVIGDGEHYNHVRRVMLPWYAPLNQRTQLGQMKDQARKLVAAWSAIPDDKPLDARTWMERYALEVSGRAACNYDFGLLDGTGDQNPFAAAVPESTKESIRRVADPRPDSAVFAGRAARARRKRY
ncbi:MAG TPA: cytochrome P450, partial [bacterium]|nr:cytochrome P450 [bacterium]